MYIPYVLSEQKEYFLKKKIFCAAINDLGCIMERAEDGHFCQKETHNRQAHNGKTAFCRACLMS